MVIGGSGRLGKKLVPILRELGHEAVRASPSSGVNTLTGEGLAEALAGAGAVVDVSSSPSFEDAAVLEFFETSTRNLLAAEAAAGVGRHVAVSVVGADPHEGQRVHAGQGGEGAADRGRRGAVHDRPGHAILRVPRRDRRAAGRGRHGPPPDGADAAAALAEVVVGTPVNEIIELAGPESRPIAEFVGRFLAASGDTRTVVADPQARYFGAALDDRGLNPGDNPRIGPTRFEDWLGPSGSQG